MFTLPADTIEGLLSPLRSWSAERPIRRSASCHTVGPSSARPFMLTLAVFHEVRVPLNTALLAVQNLEGELVFKGLHDDQEEMVHGLIGSLTMMEKVSWKIALGFPSDNGRSSTMCCHSTGWSLAKWVRHQEGQSLLTSISLRKHESNSISTNRSSSSACHIECKP